LYRRTSSHTAEHGGKRDEEDYAEMVAGVSSVAEVLNGGELLENLRKTTGIVDFVRISLHSGILQGATCGAPARRNHMMQFLLKCPP
jgi:hypothetical protein